MDTSRFIMTPVDIRNASDADYAAINTFENLMTAERLPDDAPTPLEHMIAQCQNIPTFVDIHRWLVRPVGSEEVIASGGTGIGRMEENRHLADFGIGVLPPYRQQGIAQYLLAQIVEVAEKEQRTLLVTGTNGKVPAGAAFMERLEAKPGIESHTNQLDLASLDRSLLTEWQERACERADGYHLDFNDGPFPESELPAIVALMNAGFNSMPRGSLEVEDHRFTVEHAREMEAGFFATGNRRLTVFARETATGAYAGWTEVVWHANRPELLYQGGTAVLPAYRNKGLGRWLKAANLEQALKTWPDLRFVRTNNADVNAAMLSINEAMGFKPYQSHIHWQIPTEKVKAYLNAKS